MNISKMRTLPLKKMTPAMSVAVTPFRVLQTQMILRRVK
jgi:hypothetical protein